MPRRPDTVSFLSDYGLEDEFVGVVRSVIRNIAPEAAVVDITHLVPAHDVRAGSLALVRAAQYLVPGVVLAVVDPGVGTSRRAVAVEAGPEAGDNGAAGESIFVGPDNGLLAAAVAMLGGARRAVELANADYQLAAPGPTFAGRDVFAPAAAWLCRGVAMTELGPEIDPITLRPGILPLPRTEGERLVAEVLWVDRFGNAQLNVGPEEVEEMGEHVSLRFRDQVRTGRRRQAYAEIATGEVGLVVDSYGLLSLCLDRLSASAVLGLGPGDTVSLEHPADS
jgi:S-adenosylmethionine hydrolase